MIGREWERRKAWSGPALIRRGPDFIKESWRIEDEPRVLYAKCEALYVPKYAQGIFLLFSFEGAILHKKAAKDKFFCARRNSPVDCFGREVVAGGYVDKQTLNALAFRGRLCKAR